MSTRNVRDKNGLTAKCCIQIRSDVDAFWFVRVYESRVNRSDRRRGRC